jgi:hypothetical protein
MPLNHVNGDRQPTSANPAWRQGVAGTELDGTPHPGSGGPERT